LRVCATLLLAGPGKQCHAIRRMGVSEADGYGMKGCAPGGGEQSVGYVVPKACRRGDVAALTGDRHAGAVRGHSLLVHALEMLFALVLLPSLLPHLQMATQVAVPACWRGQAVWRGQVGEKGQRMDEGHRAGKKKRERLQRACAGFWGCTVWQVAAVGLRGQAQVACEQVLTAECCHSGGSRGRGTRSLGRTLCQATPQRKVLKYSACQQPSVSHTRMSPPARSSLQCARPAHQSVTRVSRLHASLSQTFHMPCSPLGGPNDRC